MGIVYTQNALNAGELTPRLQARDDFDKYALGVAKMRNFFPLPHGGARVRYGSKWVSRTKDNGKAFLIPFEVSTIASYIIEVGNLYMRFFKNQGRIADLSGVVTGAANNGAGLIRITSAAHGLSTGNRVAIADVGGTVEANNEWQVTVISGSTFDLIGSAFVNTYTSGGAWARPYEVVTPYLLADIPAIKWAQSADTLFLAHDKYEPRTLTRASDTNFTLAIATFLDGPYQNTNTDSTKTLTPSVTTGSGTLTAVGHAPFVITHVNSLWRLKIASLWGYVKITGFTSSTVVSMTVQQTLGGTSATPDWREGSWSTFRGFPAAVNIFEQRSIWGATPFEPQTVWLSSTISYQDFTPTGTSGTVGAGDGITYRLGSNKVNVIRWLTSSRDLLIGTLGEEFLMSGGGTALTPVDPPIVRVGTSYGSSTVQAIRAGNQVYFVQRSGRKLRTLQFSFEQDQYIAPDVSLVAEHLVRDQDITRMTYQLEPDSVLWLVRDDGMLLSLTIHEVEKVTGWALHGTSGLYIDIAQIPSPDLSTNDLWSVVQRTSLTGQPYFIEFFSKELNTDASLSYDGTASTTTVTPSHTTGDNRTFTTNAPFWMASEDVGSDIILLGLDVNGVKFFSRATIIAVDSTTVARADIKADFPNTSTVPAGSWGVGITTLKGLDHLNGATVAVVGDNAVYDDEVVTGGQITLGYGISTGPAAVKIEIGLARNPNPLIETLQPAYRDGRGNIRDRFKHWAKLSVDLESTVGLTINGLNQLQYRVPSDPMDVGVPLVTATKRLAVLRTTRTGKLTFEQQLPLSATILAYYGDLEVED